MTKFLNISTDNTLGGSSPSDETVSSQKAIKEYVDSQTGAAPSFSNITGQPTDNANLATALNAKYDASNPDGFINNTNDCVHLSGVETMTSAKKIFASDATLAGNQTAMFATISNSSTTTSDNAWVGRYICGAKNLTFLMGTYRTMAGIGAHSWTNAQTGSGAGWADFYLNPDGNKAVYIGGNLWQKDSGWFKVKNAGANTGGTIQVNKGSITSPSWKDVAYNGENISDFTNDSGYITSSALSGYATETWVGNQGYITGITSSDVTTALGFTPYDASNPSGYTSNVGTVTSVNNTSPDSNGNVSLTIPTVNNATLTIQKNGTTVKTFTANASSNVTCNITVPTDTSDLTNGAGYTTNVGTVTSVNNVSPVNGNVTLSIPSEVTESTVSGWGFTKNTGTVTSVNNVSPTNGNVSLTIPTVNNSTISFTQGGVSKGSFTLNQSSGATIALDAGGSNVDIDGKSITQNSSDELQTVGVIDQNATTTAIKTWTGTLAQYNAITTKDANTLYNITDDTDTTLNLLQTIYPVGSIYIGTMSTCPMASLFGTWTLVAQDKVLQGAGTRGSVGTTLNESLPNIVAGNLLHSDLADGTISGAIETTRSTDSNEAKFQNSNRSYATTGVRINASIGSSTYQDNAPVQPDAYLVNIWQRTA